MLFIPILKIAPPLPFTLLLYMLLDCTVILVPLMYTVACCAWLWCIMLLVIIVSLAFQLLIAPPTEVALPYYIMFSMIDVFVPLLVIAAPFLALLVVKLLQVILLFCPITNSAPPLTSAVLPVRLLLLKFSENPR